MKIILLIVLGVLCSCNMDAETTVDTVCSSEEQCCPAAKHCVKPFQTGDIIAKCETDTDCVHDRQPQGLHCCPVTKFCVEIGNPCVSPCASPNAFCCPAAKHCLTPVRPGTQCDDAMAKCKKNEVCCPVVKTCVSVGDACTPP